MLHATPSDRLRVPTHRHERAARAGRTSIGAEPGQGNYFPVWCPACSWVHFINGATGKLLGDRVREAARPLAALPAKARLGSEPSEAQSRGDR
jgi:hypothetical protein